jgi:hypothetical protein
VRAVPTTGQEATTSTARRIHGSTIACVLLALAMTNAATARALQDHRSPDARDAAQTPGMSETTSAPPQDLRSPDARDAAAGPGTFNAPDVISPQVFTDRQRAVMVRFKHSPSQIRRRPARPRRPSNRRSPRPSAPTTASTGTTPASAPQARSA